MAFRVPSNFGIRGLPDIMDQAAPDPPKVSDRTTRKTWVLQAEARSLQAKR